MTTKKLKIKRRAYNTNRAEVHEVMNAADNDKVRAGNHKGKGIILCELSKKQTKKID